MTGSPRTAVAVLSMVSGLCAAAPAAVLAESFNIEVMTVRATEVGPSDARLAALRPRLRRVSGYRGFELVDAVKRSLTLRSETAILLPGGRTLRLLPKKLCADFFQMQVRLLDGRRRLLDTNLRMPSGGTTVFGLGSGGADRGEEAMLFVLRASDIQ